MFWKDKSALRCALALIAEYEKRNKWLETQNLRLIGLACPLTSSPKTEETPMTYDDERRAIELSDAAGRANNNSLPELAEKLSKQADKLLSSAAGPTFEEWAADKSLNTDKYHDPKTNSDVYSSKRTQEFLDCWQAARS